MASKSKKKRSKKRAKTRIDRSNLNKGADKTMKEEASSEESKGPVSISSQPTQPAGALGEDAVDPSFQERTPAGYAGVTLRGLLMGGADVIPGVSGGTIALIVGIYHELVASIRSIGVDAVKLLMKGRFAHFSRHINLPFLIALAVGIGIAIVSLAKIVPKLLLEYPAPVNGLFFGLILASIVIVWRQVGEYDARSAGLLIVGAIGAYLLVGLIPVETPNNLGFIFLCGAIAICAMILPGVSGSFLLLLLGKYAFILSTLSLVVKQRKLDQNLVIILVFMAGCAVGILLFARFLAWLLERYHAATLALLTGLMLGSLRRIWPFQAGSEHMIAAKDLTERYLWAFEPQIMHKVHEKGLFLQNVWPSQWTSQYVLAIVLAVFGAVFVFTIDTIAQKQAAEKAGKA